MKNCSAILQKDVTLIWFKLNVSSLMVYQVITQFQCLHCLCQATLLEVTSAGYYVSY